MSHSKTSHSLSSFTVFAPREAAQLATRAVPVPVPASSRRPADDVDLFAVEIIIDVDVAVMRLVGELDLVHRARVDTGLEALLATTAPTVVLDLSGLTFVDAHSLHAWRTAGASLAAQGRELVVREPSPFIRRLLVETNVVEFVRVEPRSSGARTG